MVVTALLHVVVVDVGGEPSGRLVVVVVSRYVQLLFCRSQHRPTSWSAPTSPSSSDSGRQARLWLEPDYATTTSVYSCINMRTSAGAL